MVELTKSPYALLLALLLVSGNHGSQVSGRVLQQANAPQSTVGSLTTPTNIFGDELLSQLVNETAPGSAPGVIISPYSIAQALAMLLNGVEPNGTSFEQLQALLLGSGQMPLEELNAQFEALTSTLLTNDYSSDTGIQVKNANSAWLKEGLRWQPQYEAALTEYYNATLDTLSTAQAINSWVSEATNGKITQIVNDGIVADAILILVNAVYFKGQWARQFEAAATKGAPFHLLDGTTAQAATMYQQLPEGAAQMATLRTSAGGKDFTCDAIQLLFADFKYAGVAAQPQGNVTKGANGLALETAQGPVDYAEALAACRSALVDSLPGGFDSNLWMNIAQPVDLYLPRFEIEFSTSLNGALQALGVTQPFEGGDLTRMAEDEQGNPVQGLLVSNVLHKVYEKVNEKGAEAAAVTAVAVTTSAPAEPRPPKTLRFDRPYLFSIVHWPSGLALFSGEIYQPEEWKASA